MYGLGEGDTSVTEAVKVLPKSFSNVDRDGQKGALNPPSSLIVHSQGAS